jgi:DNA-binding NtrC family response regulator
MRDPKRVLVAEDHLRTRDLWAQLIKSWGFEVEVAPDGWRTVQLIESFEPHILLLDLKMPIKDGIGVLSEIRLRELNLITVVISGEGEIPDVVRSIKLGAHDYLEKPVEPAHLRIMLNNLSQRPGSSGGRQRSHERQPRASSPGSIIAESPAMRRVVALVEQVAPSSASVIIRGDSGTGKEVVARAIHEYSPRCDGPYVPVNCAALPESLLESELFGHERGAFTGADHRRLGCFELANSGTLLLDEITEMKPELQAKLLRVIEDRTLRRVGGTTDIALDVRVLAATNSDLNDALRTGRLREDLYYRLNVFTIEIPRLAQRVEDLPLLVERFIKEFARANSKRITGLEDDCLQTLIARPWPGNVRELRNVIERAVIVCDGPLLTVANLPPEAVSASVAIRPQITLTKADEAIGSAAVYPPLEGQLRAGRALREVERELILKTLDMTGGDRVHAARILGISLKTVYNKLGRYLPKPGSDTA